MSTASSGLGISYHQLPEFSVSRAWRDGWKIFRQSPILFLAIVLAGNLPGGWGAGWAVRKIPSTFSLPTKIFLDVLVVFCLFFLFALAQGLISLIVYRRYNRQPGTLQADWQRVVSMAVPLLLTMLCVVVLLALGLVALVIPAFVVLTVYAVAIPVCVVEGEGSGASLTRSAELTRGHRWPISGLMIGFAIMCLLLDALVAGLWTGLFGLSMTGKGLAVVQFLVTLVPSAYFAVTWSVMYCRLRAFKEANLLTPSAP